MIPCHQLVSTDHMHGMSCQQIQNGEMEQKVIAIGHLILGARAIVDFVSLPCRVALLKNFLPFAFFVALTIALAWPLPGQKVLIPVVSRSTPLPES